MGVYGDILYQHSLSNTTENYPSEDILAALKADKIFQSMFGDVFRPNESSGNSGRNICPSRQITYRPTSGRTITNKIKNIVNVDGYSQFVTVEVCEEDAKPSIDCIMPVGYKFDCETQYVIIRLVVYDENKKLVKENFSIPSGCACTYDNL
ncbi:spz [Trypoxylus dichotomus]